MKYISDSRLNWREDPIEIIESGKYKKLHILTHPFSYSINKKSMETKLRDFIKKAIDDRYNIIDENFTALDQVIKRDEII
ncbi:Polysaccharide deacetylase OS=Ureibacillus acetophenoni OX=614649 GN=SAMN05877842_104127 PE=4 SV=1 [Ureibacillus acetophenoni]